jgi:hypothetical protein
MLDNGVVLLDNRVPMLDNKDALDNMEVSYSCNVEQRFCPGFTRIPSIGANDWLNSPLLAVITGGASTVPQRKFLAVKTSRKCHGDPLRNAPFSV